MPQIIEYVTPRVQLDEHLRDALELADEHNLTDEERLAMLPVMVSLLAKKAIGVLPDQQMPAMAIPRNNRG